MEVRVKRKQPQSDELMHYGVLGMKWGVRRYQNKDGSLTAAGKMRMQEKVTKDANKYGKRYERAYYPLSNLIKKNETLKELHESERMKTARDEMTKCGKILEEYAENDEVRYNYQVKSLVEDSDMTEDEIRNEYSMRDMGWAIEDHAPAVLLYLKDRGIDYFTFQEQVSASRDNYEAECRKAAKELLGEYGQKKAIKHCTVEDVVVYALVDQAEEDNHIWYAYY